jgi:PST family polysaccharide transporter
MRDPQKAVQVVNEQTEIAILLALPGLLFMLAFAPLLIRLLYSQDFLASAPLLPWFLLGVFGRVVSWPLGYIQVAKGEAGWFLATQTLFAMIYLSFLLILVPRVGIAGAAYAFVLAYCLHFPVLRWVGSRLIGFRWSKIVKRLLLISAATVFAAVAMRVFFSDTTGMIVVAVIFIAASVVCVYGLATRLGPSHSLLRIFRRIPLVASLIRTNVR